jgi:hypothetical protein
MNIKEVTQQITKKADYGLQITKRSDFITSTWLIYSRGDYYYYFDINEKIIFDKNHKYLLKEIEEELKNTYFEINCKIY